VVVEDVEGLRGLVREAIEIGEHLLEPVEILRLEERDGDLVLPDLRVLVERGGDSGATVLPSLMMNSTFSSSISSVPMSDPGVDSTKLTSER